METSDRVAIVALVVSLIALGIALLQLTQQFFATADGYRRASNSVIGVWSKTRKKERAIRELRLETTYVTPHITLFSPNDFQLARKRFDDVYWLSSANLEEDCCGLIRGISHYNIRVLSEPLTTC